MIGFMFAAALALPAPVQHCADAVRADSPEIAQACSVQLPAVNLWGPGGAPESCHSVMRSGLDYDNFRRQFADQPRMVAGVRAAFERGVAACAADARPAPPAPKSDDPDDCKTNSHIWC